MSVTQAALELQEPVDGEKLDNFRSKIVDFVNSGIREVTVNLDGLSGLDTIVISTLIFALRTMREHGGIIKLAVIQKSVLETLRVTGLDRVFAVAAARC
jgi:anti-anti-sigma factor